MFYEIIKIVSLSLMTISSGNLQKEMPVESVESAAYIGTWEWTSSTISGRGGKNTVTAEDSKDTKTITITKENKVLVYTNGKLECEGTFKLKTGKGANDPMANNIESPCLKGHFSIKDGMLNQYEYLGCPSRNSLYKKVK